MSDGRRSKLMARADRVLPGVWRLRLPLPWEGVPHGNAWAIASGSGVVLFDTGYFEPGSMRQLELALDQAGLRLEHVRLLVCTHAHSDHYGQAAPIVEAAGCELWMNPNYRHMARSVEDPERTLARRIEVGRQSGIPEAALERYREARSGENTGVAKLIPPDRELVDGVEVQTDLGVWHVYETPGHAPSHVCLHQPDHGLLISGDHLLGRVSLYYDYGYTPDPAGEFLASMDVIEPLGASLCLAGHGRPFRDVQGHIDANRREVHERIERVRTALENGAPKTPFEIVPALVGEDNLTPMMVNWGLSEALCYLRYLERRDGVVKAEEADAEGAVRWALV